MVTPAACKLWLAWAEHPLEHNYTLAATNVLAANDEGLDGIKRRKKGARKNVARSIPDGQWIELVDAFARGVEVEDAVLYVLATTGLRISDVLGVTREALVRGKRSGVVEVYVKGGKLRRLPWAGAEEAWSALLGRLDASATVADAVTGLPESIADANHAAYQRVRRRLQSYNVAVASNEIRHGQLGGLGAAAPLERMYPHRLRRTVAVQALRATNDLMAVKELLGHEALSTTSTYLDEARPDVVAALQRKIREK
jgi:site-specific recombinase XerC